MVKVTKPIKEFYESDKKPDYLVLSKNKNDAGVVKFIRPKAKKKLIKKSRDI